MRIITGLARGCKLKTPKGYDTRPTADRIKESVFNILSPFIRETVVLDVFAGTGNLGLEALSRGASSAVFIDQRAESIKIIRENAEHTHLEEKTQIIKGESLAILRRLEQNGQRFSLVFCDPPYSKNLCQQVLGFLAEGDLLEPQGLVVVEHAREDDLGGPWGSLLLIRNQTYGSTTQVSIFKRCTETVKEDKP